MFCFNEISIPVMEEKIRSHYFAACLHRWRLANINLKLDKTRL
jgi:hypothetical protein